MPTHTSNTAQVLADLKALALGFGFDATIEGKTLGRDVAGITAEMIAARSIDFQKGAEMPWAPNSDDPPGKGYLSWKVKTYGSALANVRTGQMLSVESLLGMTRVSTSEVQMLYGTGAAPARSSTGMGFDPTRDDLTDIEKAYFCSATRPFYEIDDQIADAVYARIEECCEEYLIRGW